MIGFCVWVFSVVLKKLYVYFEICWKLQNPSHLGVFKCAEYNPGLKKTMKGIFYYLRFCDFYALQELEPFPALRS